MCFFAESLVRVNNPADIRLPDAIRVSDTAQMLVLEKAREDLTSVYEELLLSECGDSRREELKR